MAAAVLEVTHHVGCWALVLLLVLLVLLLLVVVVVSVLAPSEVVVFCWVSGAGADSMGCVVLLIGRSKTARGDG